MPYRRSRMLVIDDFATMARVMRVLAQRIGFRDVDICHDGETALEMARARKHDYVLCDIRMHPVDGVEFAYRLRAESCGKECVILLPTVARDGAAKLLKAGILRIADGLILKPFNSNDLRVKLNEIAKIRRPLGPPAAYDPARSPPAGNH